MEDEFGSVPRTILCHECTEQSSSPCMTTKMNSQYSIDTQILLNKALDDQKRSAERKQQQIKSHQYVEQHGHTMTRNNSKDSIDTMMLLNNVLDDQNDHEKLSKETIDQEKKTTHRSAAVRSILDNLSQDSLEFNINNATKASNTSNESNTNSSLVTTKLTNTNEVGSIKNLKQELKDSLVTNSNNDTVPSNTLNESSTNASTNMVCYHVATTSTNEYGKVSNKNLRRELKESTLLLNSWSSSLLFDISYHGMTKFKDYNILTYIDERYKYFPPTIYFCPKKYPSTNGFKGQTWKDLLKDLQRKSLDQGFNLVSNGYGKTSTNAPYRRITCSKGFVYRNNVNKRKEHSNYRVTIAINDRSNGRGPMGRTSERRSSTQRPFDSICRCKFYFHICVDDIGYYVRNGYGCSNHDGHPKILQPAHQFHMRLLEKEEKLIAKSVIDAYANKGVVRSVLRQRTGKTVTIQACHYLGTLSKDLKRIAGLDELSSSDRIINFLQEKNYDYITLYNSVPEIEGVTESELVSDNFISSKALQSNTEFVVPPNEQEDANQYAIDSRTTRNLSKDQNLLVAIAWVIPNEGQLFHMFPETIFVDAVEDTNNEGRPLLTMSGCDSSNKMFNILRAFLPNQRAWSFRWIFNHVLPTMFSEQTLSNVKVIISDGDAQEYHQIDLAIKTFMPNVERVRCSWHAIEQGWSNNGPNTKTGGTRNEFDTKKLLDVISNIKDWMRSWTTSSCETEDEYYVSKQLFEKYVFSKAVIELTGNNIFSKCVMNFVRQHLEPVLPNMYFYKRKHLRHFDHNTNVKIEGMFCGMKHGCTAVTPQTTLHNTVCILSNSAERKCGDYVKASTKDVLSSKTWNKLPCGNDLNLRGEQLLTNEWKLRHNYNSCRISESEWLVVYKDCKTKPSSEYKTIFPLFKRVRKVQFIDKVFKCSCKYFERFGIPCRHQIHVLDTFDGYTLPQISDVSVIYWTQYRSYCYSTKCHDDRAHHIANILKKMRSNDVLGPSCSRSLFQNVPIVRTIPNMFVNNALSCRNYDVEQLFHRKVLNVPSGYGMSFSLTQNVDYDYNFNHQSKSCSDDQDSTSSNELVNEMFVNNSNGVEENTPLKKRKAYKELNPIFSELIKHLTESGSEESLDRVKGFLKKELNDIVHAENRAKTPKGSLVSSSSNFVKRRKTHGTKYFQK